MHIRVRSTLAAAFLIAVVIGGGGASAAAAPAADGGSAAYQVLGPDSFDDVNAIAATGAAVDGVEHGRVQITATAPGGPADPRARLPGRAGAAPPFDGRRTGRAERVPAGRLRLPRLRRDGRGDQRAGRVASRPSRRSSASAPRTRVGTCR